MNWPPGPPVPTQPRRHQAWWLCPFGCGEKLSVLFEARGSNGTEAHLVGIVHARTPCVRFRIEGVEVGRYGPCDVLPFRLAIRPRSAHASKAAVQPGDIIGDPGDLE